MAELQIKPGTKLKVAFDTAVGQKTEFNMMATFEGVIDEAYFLISAPMLAGKPLILDENQKFLLQYTLGENTFMLAGYPESVEKAGIRTYWKMRQVAEHRTFFKRRDERFKVSMRLRYLRDEAPEDDWKEAMTIDVSAGGLAMYLNDYPDVGEALQVQMPVVRVGGERCELPVQLGIVCWMRQAPKGSLYRNVCGVQFRYSDELEREAMKEYMEHVRAKYKISGPMALFSKKKENAGQQPQREPAPVQEQGTEQESAQAEELTRGTSVQTEPSAGTTSMQAEASERAAHLSGSAKRRFSRSVHKIAIRN